MSFYHFMQQVKSGQAEQERKPNASVLLKTRSRQAEKDKVVAEREHPSAKYVS